MALLYVMDPPETQQWGGVADLMRQEARQQAEQVVGVHAETAATLTGQPPAIHIREGKSRDELLKLIAEDRSISVLVLGSSSTNEGPGPLGPGWSRALYRRVLALPIFPDRSSYCRNTSRV